MSEAVRALAENQRRLVVDALRGQFEGFIRHYGLTKRESSRLWNRLRRERRRAFASELNKTLELVKEEPPVVVHRIEAPRRVPPKLTPDDRAALFRAKEITLRDVLREQRDGGQKLSDEMAEKVGLTDADLSRELGPSTHADIARRARFAQPASWRALSRRERDAARKDAQRIEVRGLPARDGRPHYAGEATVLAVATAIRAASGYQGRRRIVRFSKVRGRLKGKSVDLLRAAVHVALPATGPPSDRTLENLLTRRDK